MEPDFTLLKQVYDLAGKAQVDVALNYNDGERSWEFEFSSPVVADCFMTKSHGNFECAVEVAVEFLKTIQPKIR